MSQPPRLKMQEIVVVEGIHDAEAVREAADADIWVIGGDRVARRFLTELQRAAAVRGVVVLTDPDGPGERIRERIRRAVPAARHAFIPKYQAFGHREGKAKIGVEHSHQSIIREALNAARGADIPIPSDALFTTQDLLAAGLVGGSSAALQRQHLGDLLGIGSGNAKKFLKKLNALRITREEWEQALRHLEKMKESSQS